MSLGRILSFILFSLLIYVDSAKIRREANEEVYDVIVVGLGPSGAAAFSKLARRGKRVLALEAAQRVGGRVHTVHVPDGVLELGAEWIHGRKGSPSYELAMANNVSIELEPRTTIGYRSDGSILDSMEELNENCLQHADNELDVKEKSMGEYITRHCTEYITKNKPELLKEKDFLQEYLRYLDMIECTSDGSDNWNEVTTKSKYEDLDEYFTNTWQKNGYDTLFKIILNTYNNGPGLPKNAELKLGKEVSRVEWAGPVALVRCADGSLYRARQVLVTVSLGVLKERHSTLFSPILPAEKTEAINTISMGVINKIILIFDQKWWPENARLFSFIWKTEDRKNISKGEEWTGDILGASKTMGSDNAVVIWTTSYVARMIETMPDETLKKAAVGLLRRFMGEKVPEPTKIIKTTWYSNPLTRGSYSFDNLQTPQHPAARDQLGAPVLDSAGAPRLLFAGEATNPTHYSTVHGAMETGIREANRLLNETSKAIY